MDINTELYRRREQAQKDRAGVVRTTQGELDTLEDVMARVVNQLATRQPRMAPETEGDPGPYESVVPRLTEQQKRDLRRQLGMVKLADLTTSHLVGKPLARLKRAIQQAQTWLDHYHEMPGQGIILMAEGFGCGKTTIVKAIHHHFTKVVLGPDNDLDGSVMLPTGGSRFFTAHEAIQAFSDDEFLIGRLIPRGTKIVILDDVGREGVLKYVAADSQAGELAARYYTLINYCYERQIAVAITTNLNAAGLASLLGGATWSRLLQMTPAEFRLDLTGVVDYRTRT